METQVTNRQRLYSLFERMVNIYSPSGKEEELVSFLVEYLGDSDLSVVLRPVDQVRYNLEITAPRAQPDTLFLGHVDTVPAFDIEEYELSAQDGKCYGLGTADMKGGCAALIEAFVTASEQGYLPEHAILSLVVGEEENGDGTQALLDAYRFVNALVAEPTNLQPCTSHYGYMELIFSLFGYRKHAALSELEAHAARAMLRLLLRLENRVEESNQDIVLNIRDLHSSESGFAVPDSCSAAVDLHLPPGVRVRQYADELYQFLETYLQKSSVTSYQIDMPLSTDGYTIPEEEEFVSALRSVYTQAELRWNPGAFRSHSDANLLRDAGCAPVILGPGSLAVAHTRDEYVVFDQVARSSDLYAGLLKELYNKGL
ncbi:MAG: M20 family metallopeptidase [Spirochaetota bacterium]